MSHFSVKIDLLFDTLQRFTTTYLVSYIKLSTTLSKASL